MPRRLGRCGSTQEDEDRQPQPYGDEDEACLTNLVRRPIQVWPDTRAEPADVAPLVLLTQAAMVLHHHEASQGEEQPEHREAGTRGSLRGSDHGGGYRRTPSGYRHMAPVDAAPTAA